MAINTFQRRFLIVIEVHQLVEYFRWTTTVYMRK